MALAHNRLNAALWRRLRSKVGVRFTRFVVVAAAALTATEIALTLCNGVFHMTSTPAALVSWFCGAVVSYVLVKRLYVIEALDTPTPIPGEDKA